jgi:hypothetical protein
MAEAKAGEERQLLAENSQIDYEASGPFDH